MGIAVDQWRAKKNGTKIGTTSGRAMDEWRKKQIDNIPSMLKDIDSYEKELQSLYQKRGSYWDGNYDSVRRKARETNELIKRTQSLLKYTDAYDSDELSKTFEQYSRYNNDVLSHLEREADVYKNFSSEDEYKEYEAEYRKTQAYEAKTVQELEAELEQLRIGKGSDREIRKVQDIIDDKKISELSEDALTELDSIVEAWGELETQGIARLVGGTNTIQQTASQNKRDAAFKKLQDFGYDKETATELAKSRERQKNAEMTEGIVEDAQEFAKEYPVLSGAFSVASNLYRGVTNLTDSIKKLSGEEIDENDPYHAIGTITDTVRSTHSSEIDGRAGRIAYSAVMGILDNVARKAVGGTLGSMFGGGKTVTSAISGLLAGSQIMEQEIVSGKRKGYSDKKAVGIALTKSVNEAVWEGVGNLVFLGAGKNAIIKLLKSSGVEGGTELATNWTNRLIDLAADMDDSELKKRFDSYMEEGKSKGAAVLEALWDFAGEDFDTFLVGAVSDGVLGGSVEVMNKATELSQSRETARQIIDGGKVSELINTAKELKNAELDSIIKKLDTDKVTVKDVAKLQSKLFEITSEIEETQYKDSLKKAISDRLETLGNTQIQETTEAVYKHVTGKKLGKNDRSLLSSKSAARVISEYENRQSGEYSSDWTGISRRAVTDGDIGTRTLNTRAVEYEETVAASDFKESYEKGQDVDAYSAGYELFYNLGMQGESLQESLSRYDTNEDFTDKQAIAAYHCGWMEGMTSATDTLKTVKLPDESFASISEAQLSDGVSLVNVRAALNTSMRTQLSILDNYGREKGISFAIVENYSGVYDGAKGEQLTGTNKIVLPLKKDGGLLLHTAGHEVFHYIKQQNPTAADEMIKFITDYYRKIGKYDSIRANYEYLSDDALIDEEITADSLFDVMTNSDFINEYASKNKTVREKIKTVISDLLAHIKKALKLLSVKNPAHKEIYESLSKDEKTLTKINEMFKEAAKRFREIIYSTQVVDSVMTRSEGMRSKSEVDQMLTAFMSEPTVSYNMILDEYVKVKDSMKEGKTAKQALEKNWKTIQRCFLSYVVTEVFSAAVQAVSGALRDEDDEKFGKKYSEAFLQNLIDNLIIFNKIPIIKKVSEGLISILRQESLQDSDMIDKVKEETIKPFKTIWDAIQNREMNKLLSYNNLYGLLVAISDITGVPVSNTVREVVAIWNTVVGSVNEDLKIRRFDVSLTKKLKSILSDDTENINSSISKLIDKKTKERQEDHPEETVEESRKESKSSVKRTLSTIFKEMYQSGDKSEVVRLMRKSGLYTEKEISDKLSDWRLEKK